MVGICCQEDEVNSRAPAGCGHGVCDETGSVFQGRMPMSIAVHDQVSVHVPIHSSLAAVEVFSAHYESLQAVEE